MKEKPLTQSGRIFGLDLLGVSAALMVLLAHGLLFFPKQNLIVGQLAPLSGFLGVEMLLVLSGFLIGNHVYETFVLREAISKIEVFAYLKKIAWRILPNYYLVLLLAVAMAFWLGYDKDKLWMYFLLIQNFAIEMPLFLPESWCVTLIFFASVLLISGMYFIIASRNKPQFFLLLAVIVILISFCFRLVYHFMNENTTLQQWDSSLKVVVIYRLDSFFIGVLGSWAYYNRTVFWKKYRYVFLLPGFLLLGFMFVGVGYFQLLIDSNPFFWNVLYLPLTSIALLLFLPLFSAWNRNGGTIKTFITSIAKISYIVYLLHYTVALELMRHYFDIKMMSTTECCVFSVVYLLLVYTIGAVLHRFYERPILNKNPTDH